RARERVGGERAADVVPLAGAADAGREVLDYLAPPAHAAGHWVAAGDALAEHRQVGLDAEVALRAAQAQPKAGHNLVEDQQRAKLVAERAHLGIELEWHRPRATLWP